MVHRSGRPCPLPQASAKPASGDGQLPRKPPACRCASSLHAFQSADQVCRCCPYISGLATGYCLTAPVSGASLRARCLKVLQALLQAAASYRACFQLQMCIRCPDIPNCAGDRAWNMLLQCLVRKSKSYCLTAPVNGASFRTAVPSATSCCKPCFRRRPASRHASGCRFAYAALM
jgi:hypothetical protein